MNDQMLNEGFMSERMLQLPAWLEWMQPFMYCLLAIAVVCLLLGLLDMAMLCWKDCHPAAAKETTKAQAQTASVREARSEPAVSLKNQSHSLIKVMFLLLFCSPFGPGIFAQDQSQALNTDIRDGNLQQLKTNLTKGANINAPDADGTTPLM